MKNKQLSRLNPFEGLCLTSQDLLDEQTYHRESLQLHNTHLHGYGIVHGLQVELNAQNKGYLVSIQSGYGIAKDGSGIWVPTNLQCMIERPSRDGQFVLWLVLIEKEDEEELRQIFDTNDQQAARIVEMVAVKLVPDGEELDNGVQLRRIQNRMGRMTSLIDPVPRAGRMERAAESYLKPRLVKFIDLNRQIINLLYRTKEVREIEMETLSFNAALISAEMSLLEEGTSDRVLYRTAGALIHYANDFYAAMRHKLAELESVREGLRGVSNRVPAAVQSNEVWRKWFGEFQRLISPLESVATKLEETIGPRQ